MNKTELKNFAVSARRDLLEKVALRAKIFGVDGNCDLKMDEQFGQIFVNGTGYPLQMKSGFNSLASQLKTKGYEQLLEEVAYTWFNRIIAIRFMEVNEYLPSHVNILSSKTGKAEPDILTAFETLDLDVNVHAIKEILDQGKTDEAYRKLFIAQCNALNKFLPFLFEKINDYTEILLPDFLLDPQSVISRLTKNEELTVSFQEVEVIGWLYQFYNSEPKDKVFTNLKKNKKIEKFDIPAATQLFTPKWIVKYMVENTLGRLWLEANPDSLLRQNMYYYIELAEQQEEVKQELDKIRFKDVNLEEITIIDPCVGSGHIFVYAFDLLYQMYEEAGYPLSEIPTLILEKNLFGLDIDDRATQLASFALMMKGREKLRRIFSKNVHLNIYSIKESNHLDKKGIALLLGKDKNEQEEIASILENFIDAKNYGSILQANNSINYRKYLNRINELGETQLTVETFEAFENILDVEYIIKQAQLLASKYDISFTNPPYMGSKGMNKKLSNYLKKHYDNSKVDLYAVFIDRLDCFTKLNGLNSMINQNSWMFLSKFEKLRKEHLQKQTLLSMIHLGPRAFEDIGGEVVQTTAYVLKKSKINNYKGTYIRLVESPNAKSKNEDFLSGNYSCYLTVQNSFFDIPGVPIAYWITPQMKKIFKNGIPLEQKASPKQGMATCDNERFLRLWYEVNLRKIKFNAKNSTEAVNSGRKWFPYHKGGTYRKWYGNFDYLVNWENNGKEIKDFTNMLSKDKPGGRIKNEEYYFKKGLTWSTLSSGSISFRYFEEGFLFDTKGSVCYPEEIKDIYYLAGLLNSNTIDNQLKILAPTLDFNPQAIRRIAYFENQEIKINIESLVKEAIRISKIDWDSFETSWDFKMHPFLNYNEKISNISEVFMNWKIQTERKFEKLKEIEEEINAHFINLYELHSELTPNVSKEKITLRIGERVRDAKSFLSYFIGCAMGRYSLDFDGITYAGGNWDSSKYQTFNPNKYGIIQLTDEHYFEDDIIVRLREFLSVTYGHETVDENLQWLAESLELKRNESLEERLRRYFLDEFFKDHCQVYQKRPIYWLVDSGKEKGLKTLIYMHRYQPDTMATIRFEHLQEIQAKYHYEISDVDARIVNPNLSATEKRELEKRKMDFQKRLDELLEFDKKLAEYANAQISIDLDDGVNVNYQKFEKVLAKIK